MNSASLTWLARGMIAALVLFALWLAQAAEHLHELDVRRAAVQAAAEPKAEPALPDCLSSSQ